ncbi:tol-pal system YbgF family protein [Roseivirga sp. BDSF3-8]|uniref:tetratricopeptide repeat protein n=1 Tax=Roseivirga sp. BDSF3-8 TaxID=3241598 RepID=UPI00353223E9
MKYAFALLTSLIISGNAFSPSDATALPPDEAAFELAMEFYHDESYKVALDMFSEFMDDFPESDLLARADYNRAMLLLYNGRHEEAIPVFKEILVSGYNEHDETGGIMEQYALYKHHSATHLALVYLEREEWDSAATYIRMFDEVYPYQHFCGNELTADAIFTSLCYARLYRGQGQPEKAIKELLPHIFDSGLADHSEVQDMLIELLDETYTGEEATGIMEKAVNSVKVKKNQVQMRLFGEKITLNRYWYIYDDNGEMDDLSEKDKAIIMIRSNVVFTRYL